MTVSYDQFMQELERLAALESHEAADRAVRATLRTLGERLLVDERHIVAEQLPQTLAREVLFPERAGVFGAHEFFERVARREGVDVGFALEHAQSVCEVLAAVLDTTVLKRLRSELGDSFAELFPRWDMETLVYHGPHSMDYPQRQEKSSRTRRTSHGRTLATGRPGSTRSLADSRPMQTDSILETDDPHSDTKLSSAHKTAKHPLDTDKPREEKTSREKK